MKRTLASLTGLSITCYLLAGCLMFDPAARPPLEVRAVQAIPAEVVADWLDPQSVQQAFGQELTATATRESDAAGGCDGVKNGKYGFHTAAEPNPWWQIDLGQPTTLDHILVYNRCDYPAGIPHAAHLVVQLSADGRTFQDVYRHDGTPFQGLPDNKPLNIPLRRAAARYVRLVQPGKDYLHLDEVEVYDAPEGKNLALGRPATQSSVSAWSVPHGRAAVALAPVAGKVAERGLLLAEKLRKNAVNVAEETAALRRIGAAAAAGAGEERGRELYLEARAVVRSLALRNPVVDFDSVLFVKAAPGMFPHMSDQNYGWWARPGGGVYVLEGIKSGAPRVRCLTSDMPTGSFLHADLSYDGRKVLFAYAMYYPHLANVGDKANKANVPEDAFYHLFEMNIDGSGKRQLTRGKYDDFDGRYLPDGRIAFTSTRKGQFLQCTAANTAATLTETLPDSYVRCGGDNYRPVPVFTLHVMDASGARIAPLSAFENFEWTPAVANDGRLIYTRWDYIDRFNGPFFSLWSANANGTNPQLAYGNYTVRPQVVIEARPVPGSHKLVFTAAAHHSITGGSLVLLDRTRGLEGETPLRRLTPEVPFPETERNVGAYYANPWPLSEEDFLVAWSNKPLPPHCRVEDESNPVNATGIYLYDALGNLTLLHRDPAIASGNPIPVRARVRPPAYSDTMLASEESATGACLIQDVYQGLPGVERGTVKWVRVVGVPPKVQPHMNTPNLGISSEDPGKFVVGMAPVEADGSAHFVAPAGVPLLFQAIDRDGLAVQTMRSLTYVWPGQTLSCIGCHESREAAPPARRPIAALREASKLAPGPEGTWPLRFDTLVGPVLEKSCVSCHRPGSGDEQAAKLDLTPRKAYDTLLKFKDEDLRKLAFERDRSDVGQVVAKQSRLWMLLTAPEGHAGVRLDAESLNRLATWMDLYAQRRGSFSDEQDKKLEELRQRMSGLFEPQRTAARP